MSVREKHFDCHWLEVFLSMLLEMGDFFALKVNADITRLEEGWHYNTSSCTNKVKKGFLVFGGTMSLPSWGLPIIVAGKDCKTVKCFCLFFLGGIYLLFSVLQFLCLVNHKWDRQPKNKLYRIRSLQGYKKVLLIVFLPELFSCSFWNESGSLNALYIRSDVMLTRTKEQILWHISKTAQEIIPVFTNINNN